MRTVLLEHDIDTRDGHDLAADWLQSKIDRSEYRWSFIATLGVADPSGMVVGTNGRTDLITNARFVWVSTYHFAPLFPTDNLPASEMQILMAWRV